MALLQNGKNEKEQPGKKTYTVYMLYVIYIFILRYIKCFSGVKSSETALTGKTMRIVVLLEGLQKRNDSLVSDECE